MHYAILISREIVLSLHCTKKWTIGPKIGQNHPCTVIFSLCRASICVVGYICDKIKYISAADVIFRVIARNELKT